MLVDKTRGMEKAKKDIINMLLVVLYKILYLSMNGENSISVFALHLMMILLTNLKERYFK